MGSLLFHCSRRPWGSPDQRRNAKELTWWYDCHRHTRPQEISAGSHDGWDGCNLTEPANGFSKKHEEKPKLLVNEGCALFEMSNEHSCEKNTVTWCINMFACIYWTLKNTFDILFNETKHICVYIYNLCLPLETSDKHHFHILKLFFSFESSTLVWQWLWW